jgi:hypothetical protein
MGVALQPSDQYSITPPLLRPPPMTSAPEKTLGRRFRLPNVVSLRLQKYGRTSPLRLRGRFSLRQGHGGQGAANAALPIAPVAVPPEPAMPIGMSVIGVSAWAPVITWAIKARSSEGDDNPGIGWFRAERQCRKQQRKGDQYSFHIYKVLNVGRGIGLRESGKLRARLPHKAPERFARAIKRTRLGDASAHGTVTSARHAY